MSQYARARGWEWVHAWRTQNRANFVAGLIGTTPAGANGNSFRATLAARAGHPPRLFPCMLIKWAREWNGQVVIKVVKGRKGTRAKWINGARLLTRAGCSA